MDRARWNQIEELLQQALDRDPASRAGFLDDVCGEDDDLRERLDGLLRSEAESAFLSDASLVAAFAGDSDPVPPPSLIGTTISHYRIERRIGAGGMGEVYEAYDERLQRMVAVKALAPEVTGQPERVRRFEQEALAASRLNHPNIITIYEVVEWNQAHLIVTERVEGKTLRTLLTDPQTREQRRLELGEVLKIAIQVATALKAAHTTWIIHRDIKPENIMVRSDGVAKVLDFGIAKLSEEPAASPATRAPFSHRSSDLTIPGAVLGTATYMSPEQARGQELDGRTDLFSLGLVVYEMAAGERFFGGDTRDEGSLSSNKLERVPRELRTILRRMLEPDREKRYASAGELLDELERIDHRLESRTARRIAGWSLLAVILALSVAAIAAVLSVNESWEERILRDGHSAAARQAVFSPDGRLLVSCGEDGRIIVWDFARRERIATLTGHPAHKLAFSPDGTWFASGGTDGSIIIWDPVRVARIRVLREHRSEIGALSVSPDGSLLMSAARDGTVLWTTREWRKMRRWSVGAEHGNFVFSPDQKQILLSKEMTVCDVVDDGHAETNDLRSANWVALSPDAGTLAAVDSDGNVSFYRFPDRGNLHHPRMIARLGAHQDHGRGMVFSPDGRFVASAAEDIILWDAASRQKVARFEWPAVVWNVAFSPDGRWLVSTHADGAVLVWNVAQRERTANLSAHAGAVRAVAFAPDGRRIASAGDDRSVTVWNVDPGRKYAVLARHPTRVTSVGFSRDPSAKTLASIDQRGLTIVWDLAKKQPRLVISGPPEMPGYAVALSPRGDVMATTLGLYSTADGRRLLGFHRNSDWKFAQVYGAAFSPDGRRVAAVTDGGWLLLFDVVTRRLIDSSEIPRTGQIAVDISPDGQRLVTGEDQGSIRLWSIAPLRQIALLGRHTARVKTVAFSPDGASVASAGDDKMIALWDVKRAKMRMRIGTHATPIYSIAFSPDGKQLISGEHDGSVRLYSRQRTVWGFHLD